MTIEQAIQIAEKLPFHTFYGSQETAIKTLIKYVKEHKYDNESMD